MAVSNGSISIETLDNLSKEESKKERRRILKNVVVISLGFLLNFTAYGVGEYVNDTEPRLCISKI